MRLKIFIAFTILLFLFSCAKQQYVKNYILDPDLLYKTAMNKYNHGHYEAAAKDFLEFKNRYPLDPRAIEVSLRYADSLYKAGEYIEAEEAYLEFVKLHPKNKYVPYCYYQLGMCEFKQISTIDRDQSKVLSAYKYFKEVVEKFPGTSFAIVASHRIRECKRKIAKYNFYVGYFYYKRNRYKAAIYRFEKVLKYYPGFIDDKVLYYLGVCFMDEKKPDIAKKIFKKLIKTYPQSKYAYWAKAQFKRKLKPEKITLWRRIVDYYFRSESDVHDKYYTPGYLSYAYPPAVSLESLLKKMKQRRQLLEFKTASIIRKEYVKAEKASEKKSKEDKIPVNISANNVRYLKGGQMVLFEGNVVVTRGDFTMRADKLIAVLGKNKKKIKKINATGHVQIIYLTKYAKAENVDYDITENKVVLTGNPVIKDMKSEVKGDKIIYFIKTQQIFVQGNIKRRGELIINPE